MKFNRLIGILMILLRHEKVTADYLSEKFEVSRRTINRDIENLCMAGIPLVTTRGPKGGISIMEGYRMDRSLLSSEELEAILMGLGSLDSVSASECYEQLIEELSCGENVNRHILIDLANGHKSTLASKIGIIEDAIKNEVILSFSYYSPKGETERRIEPYYILFQWKSWYVWGWCADRKDFRLFKLNRMERLEKGAPFEKRAVPPPRLDEYMTAAEGCQVKALFAPEWEWRLREECGSESFTRQTDGRLLFTYSRFSDQKSIVQWILTFGDGAELLEPREIREELCNMGRYLQQTYQGVFPCAMRHETEEL